MRVKKEVQCIIEGLSRIHEGFDLSKVGKKFNTEVSAILKKVEVSSDRVLIVNAVNTILDLCGECTVKVIRVESRDAEVYPGSGEDGPSAEFEYPSTSVLSLVTSDKEFWDIIKLFEKTVPNKGKYNEIFGDENNLDITVGDRSKGPQSFINFWKDGSKIFLRVIVEESLM